MPGVEDVDDVRVADLVHDVRFEQHPISFEARGKRPVQYFQRRSLPDLVVHHRVDGTHAATSQLVLDDPRSAVSSYLISVCLLYTSDAADERSSVDLGGRRI